MFWGVVISHGRVYSQKVETTYHISKAILEPSGEKPCRAQLMLKLKGNDQEYMICSLDSEKHMQTTLDLIFSEGEEVSFFLKGDRATKIHLSGYLVDFNEHDDSFGEESSEEEEVEYDSSFEKKKRNLIADQDLLPVSKKMKSDMNGIKEDGDDDSDDDDDDSFDFDEHVEEDDDEEEDEEDDEEDEDEESDQDDEETSFVKGKQVNGGLPKVQKETPSKNQKNTNQSFKQPQSNQKPQHENQQQKNKVKFGQQPTPNANKQGGQQQTPNANKQGGQQQKGQNSPGQKFNQKPGQFNQNKQNQFKPKGSFTPNQKENWKQLPGGVKIIDIHDGSGPEAKKGKLVHVRYVGKLPNSKEFDRSGNKPFSFKLGAGQVIQGWDVGLQGMKVGGKRKVVIPPKMGYGNRGMGDIPANSTLNFEVELLAVN